MTTYTAIANSEIDKDSPLTAPVMTKLRDNPIAISEGHGPTTPAAGDVVLYRWGGDPFTSAVRNVPTIIHTSASSSTVSYKFYMFRFARAGTYRIAWGGGSYDTASGAGGDTYVSLYKDPASGSDSVIGTGLTFVDGGGGASVFVEQAGTTSDVAFVEGDQIYFDLASRWSRGVAPTWFSISADAYTAPIGA